MNNDANVCARLGAWTTPSTFIYLPRVGEREPIHEYVELFAQYMIEWNLCKYFIHMNLPYLDDLFGRVLRCKIIAWIGWWVSLIFLISFSQDNMPCVRCFAQTFISGVFTTCTMGLLQGVADTYIDRCGGFLSAKAMTAAKEYGQHVLIVVPILVLKVTFQDDGALYLYYPVVCWHFREWARSSSSSRA